MAEQQLDVRRDNDVTGSDVPAICGENPFSSRRAVLFKKLFKLHEPDTEATIHGRTFEPVAIDKFRERTGATVERPGYTKHPVYGWLGGTVDGIATLKDGRRVVIEVKCPLKRKIHAGEIPAHYMGQIQSYLEICDLDACMFVQYRPPGPRRPEEFNIDEVPRDRLYMQTRLPALYRFWVEMLATREFACRVVTVIQRAWRARLARKAMKEAANRLKSGCFAAKLCGFMRRREIMATFQLPRTDACCVLYVDVDPATFFVARFRRRPAEATAPKHGGVCLIAISF